MAPKDGTVESVGVNVGDSITGGHIIAVVSG
jgi:biotin carboxyl carrier protein